MDALNTDALNTDQLNMDALNTDGMSMEARNTDQLNTDARNTDELSADAFNTVKSNLVEIHQMLRCIMLSVHLEVFNQFCKGSSADAVPLCLQRWGCIHGALRCLRILKYAFSALQKKLN